MQLRARPLPLVPTASLAPVLSVALTLSLAAAGTACTGGEPGADDGQVAGDGGAVGDGGAPGDGGATADCPQADDPAAVFGVVEATPAERIPTVLSVSWQPTVEGPGRVRFWTADRPPVDAPARDVGRGEATATLLGLTADTDVEFQVVIDTPEGPLCSAAMAARTGGLPAALPRATATTLAPDDTEGGFTLLPVYDSTGGGGGAWLTILDADGAPVWFYEAEAARMRLSLDGRALLYNDFVLDPERAGSIVTVALDGSTIEELSVDGVHMDFVEVADGVIATFDYDVREFEGGVLVAGERIVEVSADGSKQVIWNIFDDLDPDLDSLHGPNPGWALDASDWAHLNHLFYDPDDDAYYVTSRYLRLVFKIDRSTGQLDWMLGPWDGDFSPAGGASIDFDAHSAVPTAAGVLIFDTDSSLSEGCSALSEFALDLDAWTAEQIWLYHTEDCLLNSFLGNAVELPGGNRLLTLSVNGQIDEVTPDQVLAWRLNFPAGWSLGYGDRVGSLYPPAH